MSSFDFQRNNLDKAASPYLRQHASNPVWWQEWRPDVLEHARALGLPLMVSAGYATCHWCHVMAAEAFSNSAAAGSLNDGYVCIKIDREERPDIDRFLMNFMIQNYGQGGWPLNVFMSPGLEPFAAATYIPLEPRFGRPGFHELLERMSVFYRANRGKLRAFRSPVRAFPGFSTGEADAFSFLSDPRRLLGDPVVAGHLREIDQAFDRERGGFGDGAKFPPHSTLLYLLYLASAAGADDRRALRGLIEPTLDAMQAGGLHDHLQGGFFRYCVDRAWTIPHFEKMLYDQAQHLWVYALAARVFDRRDYADTARGVLRCLAQTFVRDGLYVAAHDADTRHEEGGTYAWSLSEIEATLGPRELAVFREVFDISAGGNFEGKNHLVRRQGRPLPDADVNLFEKAREKLLAERGKRVQPDVDASQLTSWNALLGTALVQAWRLLGERTALEEARRLLAVLVQRHLDGGRLAHSSVDGRLNPTEYLEDSASLFLFATFIHEESRDQAGLIGILEERLKSFRTSCAWLESRNGDFMEVAAERFDSPMPSSEALAETALLRARALSGRDTGAPYPGRALANDFRNLAWLMGCGVFAFVSAPQPLAWDELPVAVLQVPGRRLTTCRWGRCNEGLVFSPP